MNLQSKNWKDVKYSSAFHRRVSKNFLNILNKNSMQNTLYCSEAPQSSALKGEQINITTGNATESTETLCPSNRTLLEVCNSDNNFVQNDFTENSDGEDVNRTNWLNELDDNNVEEMSLFQSRELENIKNQLPAQNLGLALVLLPFLHFWATIKCFLFPKLLELRTTKEHYVLLRLFARF